MTTRSSRSVSAVALLGDYPSTGLLGAHQAERFPMTGEDKGEQADAFIEFARANLEQGRKVTALYAKWNAERAERVIAFARGALLTDEIGQIPLDISPLALSLVSDQLSYMSPYLPAGVTASLAHELCRHVLAGAWLKRVNNLATIPITFKQHIGSYLPRTTFLAFNAPVKRVGRVKKRDPRPNLPNRPLDPVQVLVCRPDDYSLDEFNEQLTPALKAVSLNALPEQPLGPKYWGVRKYIEFIVFSAHPQALTSTPRAIRPSTCVWCRELVDGLMCPYCGSINQPPVGRPPTRGADVPAPPTKSTGEHIRPAWVGAQRQGGPTGPQQPHPGGAAPQPHSGRPVPPDGGHPSGPQPRAAQEHRPPDNAAYPRTSPAGPSSA
nr:hypothetical protein [Nocardiopsis baichengensis]